MPAVELAHLENAPHNGNWFDIFVLLEGRTPLHTVTTLNGHYIYLYYIFVHFLYFILFLFKDHMAYV